MIETFSSPAILDLRAVSRALLVGAHPDDVDYHCGGTVALLAGAGAKIRYVIVTSGEKGASAEETSIEEYRSRRQREQAQAARILGVRDVVFLDYADGELEPSRQLVGQLVEQIRGFKPDVVFTHDPYTRRYREHADHRVVGQETLAAAFPSAGLSSYYPSQLAAGLVPHKVHWMLLWGSDLEDFWIDVDQVMETKIHALNAHVSQAGSFAGGVSSKLQTRAGEAANRGDVPSGRAEGFKFVDLR